MVFPYSLKHVAKFIQPHYCSLRLYKHVAIPSLKISNYKTCVVPLLVVLILVLIRWQFGVLLFHTLAELFTIIVGTLMLVIAWNTRRFTHNDFLVYLGIGYFWVAVLDAAHTFTVKGMPFFNIGHSEITLHFWIYTRLFESLLLFSAALFLTRSLNANRALYVGGVIAIIIGLLSFYIQKPVMLTVEGLTPSKIYTEYLIIGILIAAIISYIRKKELFAPNVLNFLLASLVLTIFAELSFTFYTDFNGIPFVLGHLFKFLSFWMIFQAIVQTTLTEPFRLLSQASSTYDAIPHPAVVVDNQAIISQINRAAEKSCGKSRQELAHKPVHEFFHPENISVENCELCKAIKQGKHIQDRLVAFPEKKQWFIVSLTPIRVADKNSGMIHLFTDITEQTRVKSELQDNEKKMAQLLNTIPNGIQKNDLNGLITYSNTSHHRILGWKDGQLIGQYIWDNLQDETSKQELSDYLAYLIEKQPEPTSFTSASITRDGKEVTLEIVWDYLRDSEGELIGFISVISDITRLKQAEEQILHQAHFDSLTSLPNRFLSLDRLSQLINEAQRDSELVAVIYLDLDDFKKINDTLGHDSGDKLLIKVAKRLRNTVPDGDTIGRLGGDEFIVLLGGLKDAADAMPLVVKLLNCFKKAFKIAKRELILTASVGISIYPDDGKDSSTLLRSADSAMYHSKAQGRNTYSYFTESMNQQVSRQFALEEQMHGALDRGEFTLCYQPLVNITSRKITGVEALLRWNNPALGNIPPTEFIPVAEQTGLIVPIGQFVLIEALTVAARLQQQSGSFLRMSVNLSPWQFRDPDLVSVIDETIHQSGISGNTLELEITEGALLSGNAYVRKALTTLSDMGVSIAMDDFGTGYSSLSYLRKYPFNRLKIDRSFIQDITEDAADLELVNAAIAMAHGLDLKVVAEGVENEAQLAILVEQDCDYAQGFLFSKAVPAEEIAEMLGKETSA